VRWLVHFPFLAPLLSSPVRGAHSSSVPCPLYSPSLSVGLLHLPFLFLSALLPCPWGSFISRSFSSLLSSPVRGAPSSPVPCPFCSPSLSVGLLHLPFLFLSALLPCPWGSFISRSLPPLLSFPVRGAPSSSVPCPFCSPSLSVGLRLCGRRPTNPPAEAGCRYWCCCVWPGGNSDFHGTARAHARDRQFNPGGGSPPAPLFRRCFIV